MMSQENGKITEVFPIPPKTADEKSTNIQSKFWQIDRKMIGFKLHFFLFEASLGSFVPYITIFAKNRIGISASSLAAILLTQQFLFIFTKPIIGYIADYFNKLKAIISILSIVQTIFLLLLLTIPKIHKEGDEETQNNDTRLFFSISDQNLESAQLYKDCASDIGAGPFFDVLYFNNTEDIKFCFVSGNILFKVLNECSNQVLETNFSEIQIINSTKIPLSSEEKENRLGLSSTLDRFQTCQVCCKSNGACQNTKCEISKDDDKEYYPQKKFESDFGSHKFWLYALLTTIAMSCTNGLFTLSDTACCESVEKTGAQFGRQRLYGAVGWGLMSPIGGFLNDYTSDFTASCILMSVMTIISLLNILQLDLVKPKFSKNLLKDVGSVLRSKEFIAFKLCVFLNGIGTGVIWSYLVWYLTTINGSRFLCGMVQFVQCFVGEIPFMFFSGWVIKKIGHFNVLTLSLMSYSIRFFWYSRLNNPWLVLPAEGLHGITYGIFYTSVAAYAKLSSKPGTEATTQAILSTVHEGLGAGIGCVVAGLGFDHLGGHRTFFLLSVFASCATILSIILHICIRGRNGSIVVTQLQNP